MEIEFFMSKCFSIVSLSFFEYLCIHKKEYSRVKADEGQRAPLEVFYPFSLFFSSIQFSMAKDTEREISREKGRMGQ